MAIVNIVGIIIEEFSLKVQMPGILFQYLLLGDLGEGV
jgi:hypothetical protein